MDVEGLLAIPSLPPKLTRSLLYTIGDKSENDGVDNLLICFLTWQDEIKLRILREGDCCRLSGWAQCNYKGQSRYKGQ